MDAHLRTDGRAFLNGLALICLFVVGLVTFLSPGVSASADPNIVRSTATSCVFNARPCLRALNVSLVVTQGDTIIIWTSNYPQNCGVPETVSISDSLGNSYSLIGSNTFQFASCGPQLSPAIDTQNAYYSTMRSSGVANFSVEFSGTSPDEADLVVDVLTGGSFVSYQMAHCNGTEPTQEVGASPCISGPGSFGLSQFTPAYGALVVAYGTASGGSTITENQLSSGAGYLTDQGPVYPGGYQLDSLTEYSTPGGPTTAPVNTTGYTGGWGEIAVVLSSADTGTATQTVTVTQTVIAQSITTSYVTLTQTVTSSTTTLRTPQDFVPGVGNSALVLSAALIVSAMAIAIALMVASRKRG